MILDHIGAAYLEPNLACLAPLRPPRDHRPARRRQGRAQHRPPDGQAAADHRLGAARAAGRGEGARSRRRSARQVLAALRARRAEARDPRGPAAREGAPGARADGRQRQYRQGRSCRSIRRWPEGLGPKARIPGQGHRLEGNGCGRVSIGAEQIEALARAASRVPVPAASQGLAFVRPGRSPSPRTWHASPRQSGGAASSNAARKSRPSAPR